MPPRHKHHDLSLLRTKLQNIAQDLETLRCQQLTFFEQQSYLLPVGYRSIPEFTGSTAPNNIVDWLDDCEVFFASNSIPKDRRVSLATKSLRGRAAIWWKNLKSNRLRDCKPKFCDWNKFKKKFNREFNPDNHVPDRRLTSSCTAMDGHRRGRWSPPTVHISDANQTPPVPPYTANHRHLSSYSSRQPAPSLLPAQQYSRRQSSSPEGPERSGSTRSRRHVGFNLISSTSMSCPHVTTDYNKCKNGERIQDVATGKPSTPFDHGAGHVDPLSVLDPGLVYDASSSTVPGGASSSTFQPPPVTPPTDSPSSSAISGLASSSMPVPSSSAAHFSTSAVLASCHKVKDNGQEFLLADKEIPLLFDKSAIPLKIPLPFNPLAFVDDENMDNIMEDHVIGDVGHLLVERRACLSPAVSNSGNVYDAWSTNF